MDLPRACLAALLATRLGTPHAEQPRPPTGEYRIDGETRVSSGSGPTASQRTERVDGASGQRVITTQAGPPGTPPARQTLAGDGPVTWCVLAAAAPPADLTDRCDARWRPVSGGATLQADCQAGRLLEQWRQIDARTWERRLSFTVVGNGGDPPAALALAQRGLSPAQGGGDAAATTTALTERWTRIADRCQRRA